MECFKCHSKLGKSDICPICGQDVRVYRRIIHASNGYYNMALEKAKVRDLSGAIRYLQRSLHLNKNNTEARNLLGLLYYQMGEVVDALSQWVISKNLQPKNNRADYFLEMIQKRPGSLEQVNQNVKKYNQALGYAKNGSDDLAVMQLKKVLDSSRNFVKGYQLLALMYIHQGEYVKAGKALHEVLQIDKNNTRAMRYMVEVKNNVNRQDIEKKRIKNRFSHSEIMNDDVIIPPAYRENTGWQTVLNILAGLVLGAAVIFFLVMPARDQSLTNDHRKELLQYNEIINGKNEEIANLSEEITALTEEKAGVESQLSTYMDDSSGILGQYILMSQMLFAYRSEDRLGVCNLYLQLDPTQITEETYQNIYAQVKADMDEWGWMTLYEEATKLYGQGEYEQAIEYYNRCLVLKPDYADAVFWIGMAYKEAGDTTNSAKYFTQVIRDYPNTELAAAATEQRGY